MDYITTSRDYWISPNALYIEPNALGNPDYLQASCVSGAQILVYVKGIKGLDYDAGHNYRRWPLVAAPTVFNTHEAKYVYAAIPRPATAGVPTPSAANALIVFPSEKIDIYGTNAAGTKIGSDLYYYIFLGGILTSSGDNGKTPRDWLRDADGLHTIATGYLSSDEALASPTESEWYKYTSVDRLVTFLKDLTMKAGTWFQQLYAKTITLASGGSIRFGESETAPAITGVADLGATPLTSTEHIATPAYVDHAALSKLHPDSTPFALEVGSLSSKGNLDVFGNTILHNGLTIGTYNKGISGAHVDLYGNSEFESIVARTFLETPEIRKKRTTITVGNEWQTEGGGIIEQVWTKTTVPEAFASVYDGIAKLKLEPSEPGAIAVDDFCQGIFNFGDGTDSPTTSDTHDGNFLMQGFTTIYFIIKEIYTAATLPPFLKESLAELGETPQDNQYFRYELRAATCRDLPITDRNRWTDAHHPTLGMHFAAYANLTIPSRQRSRLKTTSYVIHLAGMRDWTYDHSNIQLIYGWLDGFTVRQRVWNKEKKQYEEVDKQFHGEGIAVGNIYMWGNIDQFDRAPSVIAQQLYYQSTTVPDASPSGILISTDHQHINYNGWLSTPITPSPTDRYVWQQWLYTYSDGTYDVSKVSLFAADTTTLTVRTDKSLISVAISDFYDTSNPDDITFDVTARILSGETPLTITAAEAALADGAHVLSSPLSQPSSAAPSPSGSPSLSGQDASQASPSPLSYTTEISADSKSVLFHITLNGYLSTSIDGATPEDTFLTLTLTSDLGTATSTLTIAQNREGEDGNPGKDAVSILVDGENVVFPQTSSMQYVYVEVYRGNEKLKYQDDYVCSTLSSGTTVLDGKVNWSFQTNYPGRPFCYRLSVATAYKGTDVSGTIPFIVTIDGVEYPRTINVRTVLNGTNGYNGCVIRRSEWQPEVYYRNDSVGGSADNDGNRYLDEVSITNLATGKAEWFLATRDHNGIQSTNSNKPDQLISAGSNPYWTKINDLRPLRTPFADITTALIDYLQVKQLLIKDKNNHIYGAFGNQDDVDYPLWFGGVKADYARVRFHRTGYTEYMGNDNKPNIRIGTDDDGYAVLKFFDSAGNERYNLGYMGLKEIIATAMQDHYDPFVSNLHFVAMDTVALTPPGRDIKAVLAASQQTFYRFLCSYFIDASGKKVKAGDYIAYDEHIYEHQDRMPPQNTLVNGTYAFFGNQPVQTPSGLNKYVVHLYKVVNGTLSDLNQWTRYYDFDTSGNPVLYDDQGSSPRTSQTLYARDFG